MNPMHHPPVESRTERIKREQMRKRMRFLKGMNRFRKPIGWILGMFLFWTLIWTAFGLQLNFQQWGAFTTSWQYWSRMKSCLF